STGVKARVSYQAFYYDAADRLADTVDVGTYGGSSYSRPASAPARSDTALVTSYTYDAAGNNDSIIDPRSITTKYTHDALGRLTKMVENYIDGVPTDSSNRTTSYTYNGDDELTSQTAVMPSGQTSQTTQYVYGVTTASGSAINSNDLLAAVLYPGLT